MFPHKDRFRLYIIFKNRHGLPGFHWGLLLSPKHSRIWNVVDSHLFHATNVRSSSNPTGLWQFISIPVSARMNGEIMAKALVAKITPDGKRSLHKHADRITAVLRSGVPVIQGDPNWTCRVWVEQALEVLKRELGTDYALIPSVEPRGVIERDLLEFATCSQKKLDSDLATGRFNIHNAEPSMKDYRIIL